ncbi:MAG: C-terminal binding protein [Microbacteriaceae bacterium]
MRIVIVDTDHEDTRPEQAVAEAAGIELAVERAVTEDDVLRVAAEADGIIAQYAPITRRVLEGLPRLKVVGRYGVGVDTVDVEAATERGVLVTNVPDYGTEDVSDHAIALAMTVSRATARLDRGLRAGRHDIVPVKPLHRTRDRAFGVLGLGAIGTATALKARGIGFDVRGYDPAFEPGTTTPAGIPAVSFDELLESVEVLSVHVPLNRHTHHLLGAEALGRMRPTASVINTSRGGVIDTAALVDAIRGGRLRGAGLDVFETEHLEADDPLLTLDEVVLTPHVAWYSEESYVELKRRIAENVVAVITGGETANLVNPEALAR